MDMKTYNQFKLLKTLIVSASILLIMPFGMSQDSVRKSKSMLFSISITIISMAFIKSNTKMARIKLQVNLKMDKE